MTFQRRISLPHHAFTAERRVQFLDTLSGNGNVRAAAALTGISAQAAYKARRRDPRFAAAWNAALLLAREHAEAVLADRAINGVEEVVFYRGEEVGRKVKFDSRLLLALLGRLDRRCGNDRVETAVERFDEILAVIGGAEPATELVEAASFVSEKMGLPASREEYADWVAERAIEDAEEQGLDEYDPDEVEDEARAEAAATFGAWKARAVAVVDESCHLQVEGAQREEEPAGFRSFPLDSVNPVNHAGGDDPFPEASWAAFLGRPVRSSGERL